MRVRLLCWPVLTFLAPIFTLGVLAACAYAPDGGSESEGEGEDGEGEEGEGEGEGEVLFALTSTAFTAGNAIPEQYTCNGANLSPPLSWTGAPAGTAGFGIVFTDSTNGLIHSTIWDIDDGASFLPEDVEHAFSPSDVSGAHQALAYDNNTRGYLGPCPPNEHTYRFTLYAVDAKPLAGLSESTTRAQAEAALEGAAIGTATLTVTYDPN